MPFSEFDWQQRLLFCAGMIPFSYLIVTGTVMLTLFSTVIAVRYGEAVQHLIEVRFVPFISIDRAAQID
jgi:cytochrome b subunit of formate dehydrogenase